ncbi:MAG TPA: VanZ family protein [Casimicrobiaceae bacterium]|nr:VanZ family protein [Casimicrobiaceae bacterium]
MRHGSPTRLPHVLAALYALAIAYASLQPFGPWLPPPPGTPYFLLGPWPSRLPRYDIVINLLAYLPLGFFVALLPARAPPWRRIVTGAGAGAALSLAMESLQMLVPPRDANAYDFVFNALGALIGASLGAGLARSSRLKERITAARVRWFMPGNLGDIGLALLAVWLVAQLNPGIALFAVTYDPRPLTVGLPVDGAALLLDAAGSAFQLIGMALFVTLLMRERDDARGGVLLLIGAALLIKGFGAALLLKPAVWQTWIQPGVLIGIATGALLLPVAMTLPRPAQVATCGIALLASLGTPLLAPELITAPAPLAMFEWRYGQLLNYNGLTHAALMLWPILAAGWLFALAGRPAWGRPNQAA